MRPALSRTLILPLAVAAAAWLAGPPSFDAIDGSEFVVASNQLSLCHPPSYPLFLMLLRLAPGSGYSSARILCCAVAGVMSWLALSLLRSHGLRPSTAALGTILLISLRPVLAQLDSVEVHGLAMALVMAALLFGGGRAGGYLFSLAVFGGHPLSVLLAPLARPSFASRLFLMAAIPATLLLYVPLRAGAATTIHYTHPAALEHYLAYMGLYSGRLGAPSPAHLGTALGSLGIVGGAVLSLLALAGRPRPPEMAAFALGSLALACYRVPDPDSMVWVPVLPAWLAASRGLERISAHGRTARAAVAAAVLLSALTGIHAASRRTDSIAARWAGDIQRSTPPEAVLCTVGHDAFYLAFLGQVSDRRPDLVPVDLYGNCFDLRLGHPLPADLGGRPVIATRAWDDPGFLPGGLVFSSPPRTPDWQALDIFRFEGRSPDAFAMDMVAEAWMRRALQAPPDDRSSFAREARRWASTPTARERMETALGED